MPKGIRVLFWIDGEPLIGVVHDYIGNKAAILYRDAIYRRDMGEFDILH